MVAVYYRGPAPLLADLIAGQVDVMFDSLISSIEHIRAKEVPALVVTGRPISRKFVITRGFIWNPRVARDRGQM